MWVVRGLHASARAMSAIGHHVIIDTVFERQEWLADCLEQLNDWPVLYVGVHCPAAELERRERERGDRQVGLALEQLGSVHKHARYDLAVDTHTQGLEACARQIEVALTTAAHADRGGR
jgi:chloramphenicol 3-O phosphotransferase